jgi:hypothetical protein
MKTTQSPVVYSTLTLGCLFTMSLVTNALLLRYLGIHDFPAPASMGLRALSCLIFTLIYSNAKEHSLRPKQPRFQLFRAVLGAFSLLAIITSYHYIHASTVTMLQRLDLLILCIFGFHVSAGKSKLHVWAIIFCFALVSFLLKDPTEQIAGYLLACIGATGLACGYMMMKKSQASENFSITIMVPSLSCIVLGIALGPTAFAQSLTDPLATFAYASGATMFVTYYLTLKLFERMNIATAEFPTLLATTLVMPLETFFFGRSMHTTLFIFDTLIVLWLSWYLGVPQHFLKSKTELQFVPAPILKEKSL